MSHVFLSCMLALLLCSTGHACVVSRVNQHLHCYLRLLDRSQGEPALTLVGTFNFLSEASMRAIT